MYRTGTGNFVQINSHTTYKQYNTRDDKLIYKEK